ncbi:MAG: nitroreductase family deazaflavin-dependent oxidoreductase, partial [Solirubrobacterales bacterium]|nr:nitroreductase family deazaflavin-dependent oxidoreductase [Solirubrobacterales bacterium]
RRIKVHAREADAEESRRLWPKAIEHNSYWATYRERTTREIPLVLLEPR